MLFKERFIGTNDKAPVTLASPAIIYQPDITVFKKDQNERLFIKKHKEEQKKRFKKLFGTKRPSAGKVKRYFDNLSSQPMEQEPSSA